MEEVDVLCSSETNLEMIEERKVFFLNILTIKAAAMLMLLYMELAYMF